MSGKSPKKRTVKRAEPQSFRARELRASLTVRDLNTSAAWYHAVLGFTKGKEYSWNGRVGAVQLKAGVAEILLTQDDGAKGLDRVKGEGMSLSFTTTQDIDKLAARAQAAGATLLAGPMDTPWGQRMFRLMDPDGFKLVVST